MRLKRFTPAQRVFHLLLMAMFMIQSATGLGRMYVETPFGKALVGIFGGFDPALTWHKVVGILMIVLFVIHILYVLIAVRSRAFCGPDSMMPRWADLGQFVRHTLWMIGLAKHPEFERFAYWEKFDYWAVFWGMAVIGTTGIMLYDPVATSTVFAGWGLNVALWVHRIEALLAMAHVFVIHFLVAHLRRTHFPVDRAIFTGSVDLGLARRERAAWVRRLTDQGELEAATATSEPATAKVLSMLIGLAMLALGGILLVLAIVNVPYITW